VTLGQIQASGLYRMPMELSITTMEAPQPGGRGARGGRAGDSAATAQPAVAPVPVPVQHIHAIELTQQNQVFTIPLDREPESVALDPQAWVMMQATLDKK
jgi:hypothetical protein